MLTSRIQLSTHHRPTSPAEMAALDAAATAFLAEAEGKKPSTVKNRDWRKTIHQGPSWDALAYLGAKTESDPEQFEKHGADLGIIAGSAIRTADDRPAPGNPARALDRDEWNTILSLAPLDLRDRDVLILSAQIEGKNAKKIGEQVGLCGRRVRQIQDRLAAWAGENLDPKRLAAHLDDPLPMAVVVPRRPPSRRGRKRLGAQPRPPRHLTLTPHIPEPPRPPRPYRPRVRRPRYMDPAQLDFLQQAA